MVHAMTLRLLTPEQYLATEADSPWKREFVGGQVYQRPDERNAHNLIVGNCFGVLASQLRGKGYRAYQSDTKVRIRLPSEVRFYYPDVSVVGRSNGPDEYFQDEPVVVIEVLSRKTRRIDGVEKKEAYLRIPSLSVYLLVEQEMPAIVAFRRTDQGFDRADYQGLDAVVPLGEIGTDLHLSDVFKVVEFIAELAEDELH